MTREQSGAIVWGLITAGVLRIAIFAVPTPGVRRRACGASAVLHPRL